MRSASRGATTKAPTRRCAPAAATTRSPPRSSRPAGPMRCEPQNVVKLSGIGCSSKTTAYFVSGGHGFNSVHGRMPSIATGANAANRDLTYIGVSGDGDTLSIGLGQFCHAIRRNLEHGVRDREQRRLRPDQGAVLGFGRCRQHAPRRARSTTSRRSIRCSWRSRSAPRSWRAASRATRRSWCRCCRRRCIIRASR